MKRGEAYVGMWVWVPRLGSGGRSCGRRDKIGAIIKTIAKKGAYVRLSNGHKRDEFIEYRRLKEWKSKNRAH